MKHFFVLIIFTCIILGCTNIFKAIVTSLIRDYNIFFCYKQGTVFKEETFIEEKKIYILPYILFVLYLGYFYVSYSFLNINFISKNDFYSYFLFFIWVIAFLYSMSSLKEIHIAKPLIFSIILFGGYVQFIMIKNKCNL